jgi:hypothetical protein
MRTAFATCDTLAIIDALPSLRAFSAVDAFSTDVPWSAQAVAAMEARAGRACVVY